MLVSRSHAIIARETLHVSVSVLKLFSKKRNHLQITLTKKKESFLLSRRTILFRVKPVPLIASASLFLECGAISTRSDVEERKEKRRFEKYKRRGKKGAAAAVKLSVEERKRRKRERTKLSPSFSPSSSCGLI